MAELKEIKIELTNFCKRGCIHCSSNANIEDVLELDKDLVKKVIDEASNLGVESIVFTGGEATECVNLKELVGYAKEKGIKKIKLYTMCEPTMRKYYLLKDLVASGLTEVIYSLNISLTTDGAVNFDNVQEFLKEISKFVDLSFHYCLTSKSFDDFAYLDDLIGKMDEEHFQKISFLRFVRHGRGTKDLELTSKDLKALKPKLIAMEEKYPGKVHLGSPFNILGITYTPCSAASKTMIVGFDGSVYPCDAMKYFNYFGSGGSIFDKSLEEIYVSPYFETIRTSTDNLKSCPGCENEICHRGCLAQKLLYVTERGSTITTDWYQNNALRTMNDFGSKDALKFNAYTGIIGEYGEFFDYLKKLYTHGLDDDKKQEIYHLAPKELGDLIWYLSSSLATYYGYTLDEVYAYIMGLNKDMKPLNDDLIKEASLAKDPLCIPDHEGYSIDLIDYYTADINFNREDIFSFLMEFKRVLNRIDYIESKEEAIKTVADILKYISVIGREMFKMHLSDILYDNILKLRKRYPEGFDTKTANIRIDANKKYKEEEATKVKIYQP